MRHLYVMLSILILCVSFSDGKSSSRSSSRSSSIKTSTTKSSTIKATKPAPAPQSKPVVKPVTTSAPSVKTVENQRTTTPSTIKTNVTTPQTKPKAVSKSRIDQKQNKMLASKNKNAYKKYKTKADAEKAYKETLASKNKYDSPTPPAERPPSIPQTVVINNSPAPVTYCSFPGGGYGYGYMDPVTRAYVAVATAHMIADEYEMANMGYGQWSHSGQPIRTGVSLWWLVFILFSIIMILIAVGKMNK